MDRQLREPSPLGWLLIVAVVAILVVAPFLVTPNEDRQRISLSEVAGLVERGKVRKLTVLGDRIHGERIDGTRFTSRKERGVGLTTSLRALEVSLERLSQTAIEVKPAGNGTAWLVPLLLYGGFFIVALLLLPGARSGGDLSMPLSQDTARCYHRQDDRRVSFSRVADLEEAKTELQEVVEFLRSPWRFDELGAHLPRGVLLVGPPGCGKTLLAKAVAGEAWVPFFSASGSEFVEIFAGLGAARVRSLFAHARQSAPCIVFIDEIDAVGRRRGASLDGGSGEWEQTLNQILVEMDGFEGHETVIVLAATNRPDILDPALLRPGRFDRQVVLDLPDQAEREAILKVCAWGKPMAPAVDLGIIARQTPGFSGADLEGVLNEAAILAARHSRQATGMAELQEAVEKVGVGAERKSRLLSPTERGVVAYHEAGHALVRSLLPGCDPILRVSIVPRGTHLGYTLSLPEDDRYLRTRAELKDELAGLLAGWMAEQLVFGEASTHAADDLRQASALARRMVTRFGMSKKLGALTYGQRYGENFLGQEITAQRDYSQATARAIDAEVEQLVTGAGQQARTLLAGLRASLDRLARRLLEEETVEGAELAGLVARSEDRAVEREREMAATSPFEAAYQEAES